MIEIFFWDSSDVIKIHDSFIYKYGGIYGLKDGLNALEAALDRPKNHYYYEDSNIHEMAAIYIHAIAAGHVFNDGNKRTATKISEIFLIRNGYYLLISNFRLEQLVLGVADNTIKLEDLKEQFLLFSALL